MCLDSRRGFRRNGGHGAVNAERESADTFADATFSEQIQVVLGPSRWTGFFSSGDPAESPGDDARAPFFQLFAANRRHAPTTKVRCLGGADV